MNLPNTPSEQELRKLAQIAVSVNAIRNAYRFWLCGLINHGDELADLLEPHLEDLLGRRFIRKDLEKGDYLLDNLNDPHSNKWRTVKLPVNLPNADVVIGINDISITGKTLAGFNIQMMQEGYIPVTCVYEDRTGLSTVAMYRTGGRIPVVEYLRRYYPHQFNFLQDKGAISQILLDEVPTYTVSPKRSSTQKKVSVSDYLAVSR